MKLSIKFIFFIIVIIPLDSFAARAPEIIEKEFVISAKNADVLAAALGMISSGVNTLTLPWASEDSKRNCSWGKLPNTNFKKCEDLPTLVNVIEYFPEKSELRLKGSWLDEKTGSGAGFLKFTFYSPKFKIDEEPPTDWKYLYNADISKMPLSRQFSFKSAEIKIGKEIPFIEVQMLEFVNQQRRLAISIDFDSTEMHQQKELAEKEYQNKNANLD